MSDTQPDPRRPGASDRDVGPGPAAKPAGSGRAGVVAILGAAAIVAALAWWQGAFTKRVESPPEKPVETAAPLDDAATARALVERRLAEANDYAPFFAALASRFPADSAQIRDNLAAAALADKAAATPDRFVAVALKSLRETRGVVAAKADTPAMTRVFEAQAAMLAALRQADPKLCVDFVYGGATDAFMEFSGAHRALFAAVAQAALDAIVDGGEKKIERDAPDDEDFALLEKALRDKGYGDPEIAVLLDGKTPDPPLADERMCDAARAYVEAVLAMPEPARSRVLSLAIELMARS